MKKLPSRVAYNRPRPFYFTVQPRPQPRIDFSYYEISGPNSLICEPKAEQLVNFNSWMMKLTKTQILPNSCLAFGFSYFWVSFFRERNYERIEKKSKTQNPNLVQKWRRHSRIVVHQFRRQGYYSGRMVFSSWNRKKMRLHLTTWTSWPYITYMCMRTWYSSLCTLI